MDRRKYTVRVVVKIMLKLKITVQAVCDLQKREWVSRNSFTDRYGLALAVHFWWEGCIKRRLHFLTPEVLGRIASCGRGTDYTKRDDRHKGFTTVQHVYGGWPLGTLIVFVTSDGRTILQEVAYATIVTVIADILRDEFNKSKLAKRLAA
jgi:hypothetical protein